MEKQQHLEPSIAKLGVCRSLTTQTLRVPHLWGPGNLETQCRCPQAPPGDQALSPSPGQAHPVLRRPGCGDGSRHLPREPRRREFAELPLLRPSRTHFQTSFGARTRDQMTFISCPTKSRPLSWCGLDLSGARDTHEQRPLAQWEFPLAQILNSTLKGLFTTAKWDLSLGCKDGSTHTDHSMRYITLIEF